MKPYLKFIVAMLVLTVILAVGVSHLKSTTAAPSEALSSGGNLLVNGDFEVEDPSTHGFKWYPPNHFLALNWYRWWVNEWPAQIPEYDDMRPTGRWPPYSGIHAQVYFKWGRTYEAGIYQVVDNITPCMPYELSMYVYSSGNIGTEPHAKIGLDPEGTQITIDHVYNDLLGWPPYLAWSEEQTAFRTWTRLAVTTEALGDQLTAITYANPSYDGPNTPFYDTWWDNGALYQGNFPEGRLPEPSSWNSTHIQNVTAQQQGDQLTVAWNSTEAASTQVWYTIQRYREPISPTIPMSYTIYMPGVGYTEVTYATPLDPNPVTYHSANLSLSGLSSNDKITYWVLSRRPATGVCVTEGRGPLEYVIP